MHDHPQRRLFAKIAHSRPFQSLNESTALTHFVIMSDHNSIHLAPALTQIATDLGLELPEVANFFYVENEEFGIRYEAHNEFYTLTLFRFNRMEPPHLSDLAEQLLPGHLLTTAKLYLYPANEEECFSARCDRLLGDNIRAGSDVMSGAAQVWTNFHPDAKGYVHLLVQNRGLMPYQAGRLLQRLCEVETYRHTALLGLPQAHQAMPNISELDKTLALIVHRLSESEEPASTLLAELMSVAADTEALSADTANRFGATEAYFALLDKRILELREERVEGYQTLSQFVDRRLEPARRTCLSASQRIHWLSDRIARASELIRSQVDLSIEQQNRDLLTSLNTRASQQLKLQAKLESFSIIVITYYAFDLLDRTIRNTIPSEGVRDQAEMMLSLSVPFIALFLWWYLRRLVKRYLKEG